MIDLTRFGDEEQALAAPGLVPEEGRTVIGIILAQGFEDTSVRAYTKVRLATCSPMDCF